MKIKKKMRALVLDITTIKVTFKKIKINKIEVYWSTKKEIGKKFLTLCYLILYFRRNFINYWKPGISRGT